MSTLDVMLRHVQNVVDDMLVAIRAYGKPYLRAATTNFIKAGIPDEEDVLRFAFYALIKGSRYWEMPATDGRALLSMNRLVTREHLIPNFGNPPTPEKNYSNALNLGLKKTADWVRGPHVAGELKKKFNQILKTQAQSAAKEDPIYNADEWKDELLDSLQKFPSMMNGGSQVLDIVTALGLAR